MFEEYQAYIPYVLVWLKIILIVLGCVFLFSGLDELFIDVIYLSRMLYRAIFIFGVKQISPLTEKQLLEKPEQSVAIMIPCWDESAVIRMMIDNTIRTLNYSNFHIFVGCYPNDPATQREVELARETYDNVHRIVCPKDGPTNKADCLNWVYEGIKLFEKDNGMRFEIFVMNDSEDLIHPLYLKLFNLLIPRKDMVQLPVFPIAPRWYQFTPGHYVDEFAENHARDMVAREVLAKNVPSAGVGSGYSRKALDTLAADSNNQLFNINSLTEDYDFGLRMRKYGLKSVFVRQSILRLTSRKRFFSKKSRPTVKREYVVIREFFPRTFKAAVRQKSRWVTGIALQGWAYLGWQGGFWTRYMLYRDRKALITNQVNLFGNLLVPLIGALWLYQVLFPQAYRYPPIVESGTPTWYLLQANLAFFLWRILWRAFYVTRIYGPFQGMLSAPRLIWGNLINFAATMRALKLYARYLLTGKIIAWDKTDHIYPSEAELRNYRRRLGDLLLDKRFVTVGQLDEALALQKQSKKPLGVILQDMGVIGEDQLLQAIGLQYHLQSREIDPYDIPLTTIALIPRDLALRYELFPLELQSNGVLSLGVNAPPPRDVIETIEASLGRSVDLNLVTQSDLSFAIRRGYDRLEQAGQEAEPPGLGDLLVGRGEISEQDLQAALKRQRKGYARLGDLMLRENLISFEKLQEMEVQYGAERRDGEQFGAFLQRKGLLEAVQLERLLCEQAKACPPLGMILQEMGLASKETIERVMASRRAPAAVPRTEGSGAQSV